MAAVAVESPIRVQRRMYPETDLVSLASPMFELVMRIRAEEITPSMELQKTIDEMLTQLEKRGKGLKYTEKQLETAKFALASYIDEMVLMAQFPFRDEWEKYPLQLKYFGEHLAGVKFFERLTEILRDPSRHGDLLELYYMCLLLGYKGRFRDYFEDELADVARQVEEALRKVDRLRTVPQSPHWLADDQPEIREEPPVPLWIKIYGATAGAMVVLVFFMFKLGLAKSLVSAAESLLR